MILLDWIHNHVTNVFVFSRVPQCVCISQSTAWRSFICCVLYCWFNFWKISSEILSIFHRSNTHLMKEFAIKLLKMFAWKKLQLRWGYWLSEVCMGFKFHFCASWIKGCKRRDLNVFYLFILLFKLHAWMVDIHQIYIVHISFLERDTNELETKA